MCRWLEHSPLTAVTGGWVASWPLLLFWPICHFTLCFLAIERKVYSTSPQLGTLATREKCHFHDRDNPWVHQGHLLQPDLKWAWTSHRNNNFEASVIVHFSWFSVYPSCRFILPPPTLMFSLIHVLIPSKRQHRLNRQISKSHLMCENADKHE